MQRPFLKLGLHMTDIVIHNLEQQRAKEGFWRALFSGTSIQLLNAKINRARMERRLRRCADR